MMKEMSATGNYNAVDKNKKIVSLDILRGIACFVVFIGHIRICTGYFKDPRYDFIQIFTSWGHEAVMVFFILSGVVISFSSRNRYDRSLYFKKRSVRIYPVFFVVLLICFGADHFILKNPLDVNRLIGNALLSSTDEGYPVQTMPLDPAVWSITCEVFFYIVFGLIYTSNRIKWIWVWFAICCLSMIYKAIDVTHHTGIVYYAIFLLNNSFLWLSGYLVFEYRNKFIVSLPVAFCSILLIPLLTRLQQFDFDLMLSFAGICLIPLFIYLLRNFNPSDEKKIRINYYVILPFYFICVILLWKYSNSLATSKIIYTVSPLLSFALYLKFVLNFLVFIYRKIQKFFSFLADISYPLYLVHMPTMLLVYHFFPGQKVIGMLLSIGIAITVSYFFEIFLFKKLSRK